MFRLLFFFSFEKVKFAFEKWYFWRKFTILKMTLICRTICRKRNVTQKASKYAKFKILSCDEFYFLTLWFHKFYRTFCNFEQIGDILSFSTEFKNGIFLSNPKWCLFLLFWHFLSLVYTSQIIPMSNYIFRKYALAKMRIAKTHFGLTSFSSSPFTTYLALVLRKQLLVDYRKSNTFLFQTIFHSWFCFEKKNRENERGVIFLTACVFPDFFLAKSKLHLRRSNHSFYRKKCAVSIFVFVFQDFSIALTIWIELLMYRNTFHYRHFRWKKHWTLLLHLVVRMYIAFPKKRWMLTPWACRAHEPLALIIAGFVGSNKQWCSLGTCFWCFSVRNCGSSFWKSYFFNCSVWLEDFEIWNLRGVHREQDGDASWHAPLNPKSDTLSRTSPNGVRYLLCCGAYLSSETQWQSG